MREKLKKLALVLMALCLLATAAAPAAIKATEKVALSEKKLTLKAGEAVGISLENAWDKTVTWSSNKEAVVSVECDDFTHYATLHAKKKGTAKITAKCDNKKYICTVTVKKFSLSNKKGKNAKDVKALKAILKEQINKGATLSTDLDSRYYRWDEKGNLTGIKWADCDLQGSLSLKGFASLTRFDCGGKQLTSLDLSGCKTLTHVQCIYTGLSSLDVSKNTALGYLDCPDDLKVTGYSGHREDEGFIAD